jgi:hypothetical protein
MAKIAKKRHGSGFRLPKKWMKHMILLVGAIMLFSGLYSGIGMEDPQATAADDSSAWTVISYDSAQIGDATALTKIIAETNQYKLRPNQMSLMERQDINDIFESNITGVKSIVFENAPTEEMFAITTDGTDVAGEFRRRVRVPGGYEFLRVYKGSTPYGQLDVLGDGLRTGEWASVLLLQRVRGQTTETLAFVKKRIPQGPIVNVTAANITGTYFDGTLGSDVTADEIKSQIKDAQVSIDGSVVTVIMPGAAEVSSLRGALEAMNISGVSAGRLGYVSAPDEMVIGDNIVVIPEAGKLQARLKIGTKAKDTVEARIDISQQGNLTAARATQI